MYFLQKDLLGEAFPNPIINPQSQKASIQPSLRSLKYSMYRTICKKKKKYMDSKHRKSVLVYVFWEWFSLCWIYIRWVIYIHMPCRNWSLTCRISFCLLYKLLHRTSIVHRAPSSHWRGYQSLTAFPCSKFYNTLDSVLIEMFCYRELLEIIHRFYSKKEKKRYYTQV